MNDPQRVQVVTDGLRDLRNYLRGEATDNLRAIKGNVDDALLPIEVWGVRLVGAIGAMPTPGGRREPHLILEGQRPAGSDPTDPSTWRVGLFGGPVDWVDDPLTSFKKNYEAAHASAVSRLGELIEILDEIAASVNRVADYYDEMEDEGVRDAEGIDPE